MPAVFPNGGCFWCGAPRGKRAFTRDHLIPVWAARRFSELRTKYGTIEGPHRVVSACGACNFQKGGMPPERFYHLRLDHPARRKELALWTVIQRECQRHPDVHRSMIIEAMLKPIPGYIPPLTPWTTMPFNKNKPLRRLYTIIEVRQWDEDRFAK